MEQVIKKLILNINHLQRRVNNARVAVAEEVILVLHLRQYARPFQFDGGALPAGKGITKIRFGMLKNLHLLSKENLTIFLYLG